MQRACQCTPILWSRTDTVTFTLLHNGTVVCGNEMIRGDSRGDKREQKPLK